MPRMDKSIGDSTPPDSTPLDSTPLDSTPRDTPPPGSPTPVVSTGSTATRRLWKALWAIPRIGLWLTLTPLVLITGLWSSFAIYFSNLPGELFRSILAWAFGLGWLAAFLLIRGRLRTAIVYGIIFALLFAWWCTIPASNDRTWTPDVAQMPKADVDGNIVTIENVRNFDYRTVDDFDQIWETRTYNIDEVETLDLILSDWGLGDVVHTMLSLGFKNGDYLCLSAETRREQGEPQTFVRGLFKQYELIYVLADERDLLRLRTNFRKEDVYVYPTATPPEGVRAVLFEVIEAINKLNEKPKHYHTLTHNCTMGLLPLLDPIRRHRSWDIRYLKNGLTAEMVHENGGLLPPDLPYEEIKQRALANQYLEDNPAAPDYSRRIRAWQKRQ